MLIRPTGYTERHFQFDCENNLFPVVHFVIIAKSTFFFFFVPFFVGPGNVMDHVIIERENESTIMFVEGAKRAYLGHVTLKVCGQLF